MSQSVAEFTGRAIGAGVVFGMLFGAANAYLGLRVGMTVSTSIPVAIMAVAVLRFTGARASLLEINLAQTTGSASTSLATGAIFTLPALWLWGSPPTYQQIVWLTFLGGVLGVAAMIPLRHLLIVRSAKELTYPEGTACAEVLFATERRLPGGAWIFRGLAVGIAVKLALDLLAVVPGEISWNIPILPNAEIGTSLTPALLGVGYILGYRRSGILVSGSLISWLVLIPVITLVGAGLAAPLAPEAEKLISQMDAWDIWGKYIRYIGAGAVAGAGIVTVVAEMPRIVGAFWAVVRGLRAGGEVADSEREMPGWVIGAAVLTVVLGAAFIPTVLGDQLTFVQRVVCAGAIAVFGIIFVAVMARIAGIVGTSSQPTSGITIVTLLAVGALFAAAGWTMDGAKIGVLCVGSIVAIAASSSGDTAQDLKTGHLVGATPAYQQFGQLIGAATACWVVAATLMFLGKAYTFGSEDLPAPQATLISLLIQGVLDGTLPWTYLFAGIGMAIAVMLAGLNGLAFAIGLYLPLVDMLPIFIGGLIRHYVEWRYPPPEGESGFIDPGMLGASGLVAGEGLAGVAVGGLLGSQILVKPDGTWLAGVPGELGAVVLLGALAAFLIRAGKSRLG